MVVLPRVHPLYEYTNEAKQLLVRLQRLVLFYFHTSSGYNYVYKNIPIVIVRYLIIFFKSSIDPVHSNIPSHSNTFI